MSFNLKSILNPAPSSGGTTPLPPANAAEDEMAEQTAEHNEGGGRAGAAADKLAGLTLNTTNPIEPTMGTQTHSSSPIEARTSPNSSNAPFPYAAPRTSMSHEAPALQSFVPVPVDRSKTRVPSSGSAGRSSTSPTPAVGIFVKEEEDESSVIMRSKEDIKEFDPVTQATVQALRNEHGTRGTRKSDSATPSAAPKRSTKKPASKKGMAKKAGAAKKRKSSETKKPSKEEDEEMMDLEESEGDEEVEEADANEEDEVYCICRKPDDHKYMIGCDGGCGDWFHGTCVKITEEQGRIIDKFICPNCNVASGGVVSTTWRPICRLPGCVLPARVENTIVKSLYCSDEHGRAFWTGIVREQKMGPAKAKVKKTKTGGQENKQGYHRGGALPPSVLKSLLANVTTMSAFQSLGETVPIPSHIKMPDTNNLGSIDKIEGLSPEDLAELNNISNTRTSLISRRKAAQNRSKLLTYAIARRDSTIAKLGVKRSAWCGYDADLILPPSELEERVAFLNQKVDAQKEDAEDEEIPDGVCQKKNCGVHVKWADTEKQDCWMEIRMWNQRIEELDRRIEEIGEAAARRGRVSS